MDDRRWVAIETQPQPGPPPVTSPLRLVIFDCDGVLVDSEPIANRVFAEMVNELGLTMTAEDVFERFVGRSMRDSPVGVAAGLAAGMPVLGYAAGTPRQRLLDAGAHAVFDDMRRLPSLLDGDLGEGS